MRRLVGWTLIIVVPWVDVLALHVIGLVRFGVWS
jgi:hypothetical protein